jgi:hypothetical protein
MKRCKKFLLFGIALFTALALVTGPAAAQQKQPNIVVTYGATAF